MLEEDKNLCEYNEECYFLHKKLSLKEKQISCPIFQRVTAGWGLNSQEIRLGLIGAVEEVEEKKAKCSEDWIIYQVRGNN